ncbi:hypothetical protein [Schleiferilactobacillus harbinensis]|jgi:hypothetical protein|uniref:Redoxin domain-containing protein n=2 Tax=Schleiferilactobacillus harbinensis TaxID=304207 RepID=A0ABU7T2T3_9LACO|nr:hypothetical protein [Schleiferilactobacillus harbinensis]KRM25147.1 hypothetical protein FC91_GL001085 [Schleiferilactobacillus harbinensis DSM 16991]
METNGNWQADMNVVRRIEFMLDREGFDHHRWQLVGMPDANRYAIRNRPRTLGFDVLVGPTGDLAVHYLVRDGTEHEDAVAASIGEALQLGRVIDPVTQ